MAERYWLRHPSLQGMLGPYDHQELRAALAAGSFPADSYVLPDLGQSELERQASPSWRPVYIVLDLPRPAGAEPTPTPPAPPRPTEHAERLRRELRQHTAYQLLRRLVTIGAVVGIGFYTFVAIVAIAAGVRAGTTPGGGTLFALLAGLAWEVLVVVIVAGALQALFDLADAALHGHARQRASS